MWGAFPLCSWMSPVRFHLMAAVSSSATLSSLVISTCWGPHSLWYCMKLPSLWLQCLVDWEADSEVDGTGRIRVSLGATPVKGEGRHRGGWRGDVRLWCQSKFLPVQSRTREQTLSISRALHCAEMGRLLQLPLRHWLRATPRRACPWLENWGRSSRLKLYSSQPGVSLFLKRVSGASPCHTVSTA